MAELKYTKTMFALFGNTVHSEGINVATLNESFGHGHILLLHTLMLQSEVIHDAIDLTFWSDPIWSIRCGQLCNEKKKTSLSKKSQSYKIYLTLRDPVAEVDFPRIKIITQISVVVKVRQVIGA